MNLVFSYKTLSPWTGMQQMEQACSPTQNDAFSANHQEEGVGVWGDGGIERVVMCLVCL